MVVAIITGASSGMGREAALQIAKKYQKLDEIWLIARRVDRLERMRDVMERYYAVNVRVIGLDLQQDGWQEKMSAQLKELHPKIFLLFNAAGYGRGGNFAEDGWQEQSGMVRLNCEALTTMTHICLPYMKEGGHIIQIASSAGFAPQPSFAVYAASKAYVLSFSRALAFELKERRITVTAVCPGPVDTEFFQRFSNKGTLSGVKTKFMAKASHVVRLALNDAEQGKEESVYGLVMRVAELACKLFPWKWIAKIMMFVNKKNKEKQ